MDCVRPVISPQPCASCPISPRCKGVRFPYVSAPISGFSCSSKAFKSYGTQKYLTKVKKVTAVAAGVPWRLVRPMLRDDGRVLRLGYAVLHTNHLPWPGYRRGRSS